MRGIDVDTLAHLYAWVDQECADGLTSGAMVLRPAGRPTRRDLLLGLLQANSLLLLDPAAAHGHLWPDAFRRGLFAQGADRPMDAAQAVALGELQDARRCLVEQWKRVGIQRWSDAAFLGVLGDLTDDAAFAADVEHCLTLLCRGLMADPSGPEAALRTAAQAIVAGATTQPTEAGYRLQRRCDAWLGGGIDDLPC